jgi:hypothetical protein
MHNQLKYKNEKSEENIRAEFVPGTGSKFYFIILKNNIK